ncbi:MAG: FAD-dependent pyridine nucleotide-disulfide oxidoreductase [Dehalococcoidia bacterium]|nr:FAD-dependent pyridine nucleotide-disulfide oxidoreductase [Dehalococcoidia bacterium]
MVHHGITREDFHRYYMPRCRQISLDNRAGQVLFVLNEAVNDSASFFAAHSKLADEERAKPRSRRPFNMIIWGMFTGSYSYRHILMSAISPTFLGRLLWEVFREKVRRLSHREPSRHVETPKARAHRDPGAVRILVLGGGFAGVHSTLRLEKALRGQPDIDLTLVSNENFFLFTPLLHEVATGGVETRHIAYPYRKLRGDRRFNFLQREVRSIDLAAKKVQSHHRDV